MLTIGVVSVFGNEYFAVNQGVAKGCTLSPPLTRDLHVHVARKQLVDITVVGGYRQPDYHINMY